MAKDTIVLTDMSIPNTNGAEPVTVEDSTTDAVKYQGWSFDASTDEHIDLFGECGQDFDNTKNIEVEIPWLAASDTTLTHKVRWVINFVKIVTDSSHTDIAALNVSTYSVTTVNVDSTLSASGDKVTTCTGAISSHGCSAGDKFHIRISRDAGYHTTLEVSGDAYIMPWLRVREAT